MLRLEKIFLCVGVQIEADYVAKWTRDVLLLKEMVSEASLEEGVGGNDVWVGIKRALGRV